MDPIEISDLFIKDRLPKIGWQLLQIILYSPCGLALAILRFFILIQAYLAAALLPETSLIRRIVLRIICVVLGVIVQEENRSQLDKKAKVIMTNHITLFDHIPLHLVTGCIASFFPRRAVPMTWGLKDFGIKQGRDIFKEKLQAFLSKAESPLLIHPEEETTSGKVGLLKFSSWYGFASSIVQPVCLKVYRPSIIDISPNILHSSAITDLFWFLFTPFTVFKIKYLPVIIRKTGETDEEIIDRIETDIAQELGVRTTHFNASDKAEYQKRCIADLNSPVIVMAEPSTTSPKNTSHEYESVLASNERMASQVAEILPHVPIEVIKKDLFKTRNIDLTIANILEGVVYYIPIPVAEEPPVSQERHDTRPSTSTVVWPSPITNMESFSKSAQERMMSLAERKKHLIETARKRYIEQHGLNSL